MKFFLVLFFSLIVLGNAFPHDVPSRSDEFVNLDCHGFTHPPAFAMCHILKSSIMYYDDLLHGLVEHTKDNGCAQCDRLQDDLDKLRKRLDDEDREATIYSPWPTQTVMFYLTIMVYIIVSHVFK